MAQTGYTPIQLYYSTTAAAVPTAGNLANGELAINITDGKLYYKNNSGVVTLIAGSSAGPAGGSNTQVQYNSSGVLAGSANMTFDGTTLTAAGFSGPHNGTVGATTPNTGSFTTLTTSSTVTLNGGTANGVTYLNASKVLTSNSALSFDGTTLTTTSNGSTPALRVYGAGTAQGQISFNSTDTYKIQGGPDYLALNFFTNGTNRYSIDSTGVAIWSVGGSESMRLTSTGLGIGTSSPAAPLSFAASTGQKIRFFNSVTGYGIGVESSEFRFVTDSSASFTWRNGTYSGGTTYMTLDASGNLGLGATPNTWNTGGSVKVAQIGSSVVGTTGGQDTAFFGANYYINSGDKYVGTGFATQYRQTSGQHQFYTAPSGTAGNAISFTQAMTLNASGNLGLGTTSPTDSSTFGRALDIQSSGGAAAYFRASGTNPSTEYLAVGYSPTAAYFYNSANSPMYFYTNATERFRIAANGAWGLAGTNYGTAGQVLTSNGSGSAPTWQNAGGGGTPGGSNTQVQYNSSGSFAGSSNLTFNGTGLTSGFFAPSSSTAPSNGILLSSANTLGFASNSQSAGMFFNNYQIGSTGTYVNQLSIGATTDTANYQQLQVYTAITNANQGSTSTSLLNVYSYNGNTPFKVAQTNYAYSNYNTTSPSNQYCPIGAAFVAVGPGAWQPTQFPAGSFQVFPQIGVYAQQDGQSGYPQGTAFYATAASYYVNSTAYYARTSGNAPTSGSGYCYRAEIGSHAFGSNMVGLYTRIVSGQGGSYATSIGWIHNDETANGSAQYAAIFYKAGSTVGSITLTSSATTYNTSSDPRQKDVTGPITFDEAKNFVMALQPKKGTWKSDGSVFQGFLSTEYELVDPSAVSGVAGATEIVGNIISADGNIINSNVTEPPADKLPPGGKWEQTEVKDIYQSLEYGSAAWCANMTAHAQYLQNTIEQLLNRISALENK